MSVRYFKPFIKLVKTSGHYVFSTYITPESTSHDDSRPMCLKTQGAPPLETYLREAKMFQPFSEVGRSTFGIVMVVPTSLREVREHGSHEDSV
jgi:hypothetical protein